MDSKTMASATTDAKDGKTALVIGRFQPFHSGHLEAVEGILKRHSRLLLAIGSAQESRTPKNPFSSKERKGMIAACLKKRGILPRIKIILLDDENHHERWVRGVLQIAKDADVVYSGNWLVQRLLGGRYAVHTMKSSVKISASQIRELMKKGDEKWQRFVPKEISEYILTKGLEKIWPF
ncbi:MAG: adenylyltransferase/cytidyltransferase family protein [Candidatus Micrarchaeota archaeon]